MPKPSAGILMYRRRNGGIEVLLVHPGGPFWAKKDVGAWSIPKGEYSEDENPLAAARREFQEETGATVRASAIALGELRQKGGKVVIAFAIESDFDTAALVSNEFEMEWPPRSGRRKSFPEVDRAEWFTPDAARRKINPAQRVLIDRLLALLNAPTAVG